MPGYRKVTHPGDESWINRLITLFFNWKANDNKILAHHHGMTSISVIQIPGHK